MQAHAVGRIRHRMDALYGETFRLDNISDSVLERIDDFFGPVTLDTVSQVIHFARHQCISDKTGFNRFVDLSRLRKRFGAFERILSVHGEKNGLLDAATPHVLNQHW